MKSMSIVYISPDGVTPPSVAAKLNKYSWSYIDFYTMNMTQLLFISKNRIMPMDTLLVLVDDKIVLRNVGALPKLPILKNLLLKVEKDAAT